MVSRPKLVLQNLEHDQHVSIKFTSILTRTNLSWMCLSKIRFLYSFLFPCIKVIIYKIRKTLKLYFISNFAKLQLGWNLRYSCKYYIAKLLCNKRAKLLYNKKAKLPYNKKLYILTNENHRFFATSNTLATSKKEPVHWNIIGWAAKPNKVLSSISI